MPTSQKTIQQYKALLRQIETALGRSEPSPRLSAFDSVDQQELSKLHDWEDHAAMFWQERWKKDKGKDIHFWWAHLIVLLEECPRLLPEILTFLGEEPESVGLLELQELRYEHQAAFAQRTSQLIDFEAFVEGLISKQESELEKLLQEVIVWFTFHESEILFASYHELITLHNLLEKGIRRYAARLTKPDILEKTKELSAFLKGLKAEIQEQLHVCEALQLIPFQQTEKTAYYKELFHEIAFFRDVQSSILYQLSDRSALQDELAKWLEDWENLENLIVSRVQGRLRAFSRIQEQCRQKALPVLQASHTQMLDITKGITARILQKLDEVIEHTEKNTAKPTKVKSKSKASKRLSLEDFKDRYENEWRGELIKKSRQERKEELQKFRQNFKELLVGTRSEVNDILEATRETITEIVEESKADFLKNEATILSDQASIEGFFQGVRQGLTHLLREAAISKDWFWNHYPALTLLQQIRETTTQKIDACIRETQPSSEGETEIILIPSPLWTRPVLERAMFLALFWSKIENCTLRIGDEPQPLPENLSFLRQQLFLVRKMEFSANDTPSKPFCSLAEKEARIIFSADRKPPTEKQQTALTKSAEITFWITPSLDTEGKIIRFSKKLIYLRGWSVKLPEMLRLLSLSREEAVRYPSANL